MSNKLDTAILAPGQPLVVVNAGESEPASQKDRTLIAHRPHLVLDGAGTVAAILGAHRVVVHLHRGSSVASASIMRAIAERRVAGRSDPLWEISLGPDRYVSGEASAIAALLEGGEARPLFSDVPMARRGPSGRPTVVNNAETVAQVGILARQGAAAWSAGGSPSSPGTHLFTLTGAVPDPGRVLELVGQATFGELLSRAGLLGPPAAVLVGGFAGAWLVGRVAWTVPAERAALEALGVGLGCGLVGVLPHGACGLAETARLVDYLAGETAGQCGSCVYGLPRLARSFSALAAGTLSRRALGRTRSLAAVVEGGGACGHPDGVVRLVRSALDAFQDDVVAHLSGRPCLGASRPPEFRVPQFDGQRGWR